MIRSLVSFFDIMEPFFFFNRWLQLAGTIPGFFISAVAPRFRFSPIFPRSSWLGTRAESAGSVCLRVFG